jgi:hypothetical protein
MSSHSTPNHSENPRDRNDSLAFQRRRSTRLRIANPNVPNTSNSGVRVITIDDHGQASLQATLDVPPEGNLEGSDEHAMQRLFSLSSAGRPYRAADAGTVATIGEIFAATAGLQFNRSRTPFGDILRLTRDHVHGHDTSDISATPAQEAATMAVRDSRPPVALNLISRQVRGALNAMQDVLVPFTNVISHMPDLGEDFENLLLFRSMVTRIDEIASTMTISKNSWMEQWKVYFVSLHASRPDIMKEGKCMVCMEEVPVINLCNNSSPHLACPDCLMAHYWVSTEECCKSSATCPMCRKPITLREIIARLANMPNVEQKEPILSNPTMSDDADEEEQEEEKKSSAETTTDPLRETAMRRKRSPF